jgi:hypothetical protein
MVQITDPGPVQEVPARDLRRSIHRPIDAKPANRVASAATGDDERH